VLGVTYSKDEDYDRPWNLGIFLLQFRTAPWTIGAEVVVVFVSQVAQAIACNRPRTENDVAKESDEVKTDFALGGRPPKMHVVHVLLMHERSEDCVV
jgi:hypothetical protein